MPPPALTLGGFGVAGGWSEAGGVVALGDGLFVSRACLRSLNEVTFAGVGTVDGEVVEERARVETGFMRSSEVEDAVALIEDDGATDGVDSPGSDESTILMGTLLLFGVAAGVAEGC